MKQIRRKVEEYIGEKKLLTDNQSVIIGLSGGADSMALLHILVSLGYKCIAAHCNFHLRAEESDRDELFVESYCRDNNIEYISTSFDTYSYMREKSISLEMAARELRYNWFEELSLKFGVGQIAIAHHRDDSAETVLINITRGCGIRGLTGIMPKNGKIVRPLLCISRKEVLEYLNANRISFVEDSTNKEDDYTRNKIRLNIFPLLEEINPSVKQSIQHMTEYLSGVESIYLSYIAKIKTEIFDGKVIDLEKLLQQSEAKTILYEILYPYGFNSDIIHQAFESINGISGKIFLAEKYRLIKDRKVFILEEKSKVTDDEIFKIEENDNYIEKPLKLNISSLTKGENFSIEKDKNSLYIDKELVNFPLYLRHWQQGDKFIPIGMKGRKKISDYFSDNKFSISQKESTWLLCSADNKIIWVVGERPDDRFKITNKTVQMLKIELLTV